MDETVQTQSAELSIRGMSCANCVARVEAALREIPGVESVDVAVGHARIVYQPDFASRVELGRRIEALGYRVAGPEGAGGHGVGGWLRRMAAANARNFGSGRLDCCTVGRKKPPAP